MTQRIIQITKALFQNDAQLQEILGENFPVYYLLGDVKTTFPHIAHEARIKATNDPVFFGNYMVDVLDHNQDCSRILAAGHRIKVILNRHLDTEGGGGLRFFFRDEQIFTKDEWLKRNMLLFSFRGVDTALVRDSLSLD